jgi:hypothetical protein
MIWLRTRTVLLSTILCLTMILCSMASAVAAERPFGFGVILGEPTGLSAKYLLNRENAIDLAVAWNLSGDNDFTLHADYLWHNYDLFKIKTGVMPVYFGVGARMELRDNKDDRFGVRIPVGVSYQFAEPKFLELFGEIAPILDLAPSTKLDLNVGIGARFYLF